VSASAQGSEGLSAAPPHPAPESAPGPASADAAPDEPAKPAEPGEPPEPPEPPGQAPARRRRHWLWWVLSVVLVLVVVATGAGFYVYHQLNRNIAHTELYSGITGDAGKEVPDPFGRVPINILVIGSDTRANKVNCKLGGDCDRGPVANADVEMVVHVSADRSNVTVMSVPRDTVADLPGCRNAKTGAVVEPRHGQINATLTYGPGCTVAAVHQVTGIPIDHFVMVDFAGVISMSDSVGGVSVCVTDNVYDTYSHLKLTKGKHTLKGLAALEFVRSRHAFGDGSDLGRTYAQHVFLSAAIRSLKRKGVLLNPVAVYSLAQAATKALTVDTGLGSIPKLLSLASDLNKVPTERVTFTTMQTTPDPEDLNRVLVAPAAKTLFSVIINDRSLTASNGQDSGAEASASATTASSTSPTPTPTVTVDPATVKVQIRNASGHDGRALALKDALRVKGFSGSITTSATTETTIGTRIYYPLGSEVQARTLAKALKLPQTALEQREKPGILLLIGSDWVSGTRYPSRADTAKAALDQAHSQTAKGSSCVPVSTQHTVTVNGISMTPIQAYDATPDVPVSAH
jgi:LCP family protein required for cell wall assembly